MTVAVTLVIRSEQVEAETLPWTEWCKAWGMTLHSISFLNAPEAHSYRVITHVEPREIVPNQLTLGG